MKMATPDFEALKAAIRPLDTEERRTAYREGRFPRADKVNDLEVRYRWDLFWAVGGMRGVVPEKLNEYKDAHIDTALRRIVPALNRGDA